jgi:zinc transport system substrate-binding protein
MICRLFIILPVSFCLLFIHCKQEQTRPVVLSVFVSIVPQKYIIDKIGGSLVAASVMVEPGASPHSYEPRPFQMTAMSKARAYFSLGLEFEKVWLPRFRRINGAMAVFSMDSGIVKRPVDLLTESPAGSTHDRTGHQHEGADPHIWLSPELVKKMAKTACDALCKLDPGHDSAYITHWRAFEAEIAVLQDTIRAIAQSSIRTDAKNTFMVFHPSWGYFADEFKLRQVAIEVEGKEPSARQLQTIVETAKTYHIHTIFVQPQFSQRSAGIIARQIGGRVAIADDLAYDWKNNLIAFSKALALQ